jgi:hypothetical protein
MEPRNLLSRISVTYINPLIAMARAGQLDMAALKPVTDDEASAAFAAAWAAEARTPKPSIVRALKAVFLKELLAAASIKLAWSGLIVLLASFFVRYLLSWVRAPEPPFAGWVVSAFFFVGCMCLSVALQQVNAISARLGVRVSSAVSTAVYQKSLREDRAASAKPVDVVSLVATDCAKLSEGAATINFLWSAVVEALAIFAVLLGLIGRSALPG